MIQGSDQWRQARLGRVTASRIADVIARTKSGYGASRATYMGELIAERLTGVPQERYQNAAMEWGTQTEPEARAAYEFYRDIAVEEVGFLIHPTIDMAGASPDGLAGNLGLVEIKAPNTSTHIETLLSGSIPHRYFVQMQWQLACVPGREFCDFVSYDPRMPEELQLFVRRVHRSDECISELEEAVSEFLAELDEKIIRLKRLAADDTPDIPESMKAVMA